jgi:DNA-binding response OmpR family regulator
MTRFALVVDDDPVLQRAMIKQLQGMGFDAEGALHYEGAVQQLKDRHPTLVCIDLELPTRSGYELCEYIRGPLALGSVPILVTSNSRFAKEMANAEEAGANAFLAKPFSMRQLTNYVDALLRKPHQSEPYLRRLQV